MAYNSNDIPKPEQEPVANIRTWHKNGEQHAELWNWDKGIEALPDGDYDLYTTPPQRTWVGLTQTEVVDLLCEYNKLTGNVGWQQLIYMTEAKLKAKNERLEKNT